MTEIPEALLRLRDNLLRDHAIKPIPDCAGVDVGYDGPPGENTPIAVRIHTHGGGFRIVKPQLRLLRVEAETLRFIKATYFLHSGKSARRSRGVVKEASSSPVAAGVGIKPSGINSPGTVGLILTDSLSMALPRQRYALTCAHVISSPEVRRSRNFPMIQPSDTTVVIGRHLRFAVDDVGDAVLVQIESSISCVAESICGVTILPSTRVANLGDSVAKCGAATRNSEGVVDGVGTYFLEDSAQTRLGVRGFRIIPVSHPQRELCHFGDSGSVWFSTTDRVGLGLHIGGDNIRTIGNTEFAIACNLEPILSHFNVVPFV